tara:strand:- start:1021 stop:1416 length:396 start_codon:yes stop_codon:yes gene_type:complete
LFKILDFFKNQDNIEIMDSFSSISKSSPEKFIEKVAFQRLEMSIILSLYGRMVAAGEWRDYGISMLHDAAIFSIFKRTAEHPIYRIEKRPRLKNRQGEYAVIGMDGRILKRGHDLKTVIQVLERKLIRSVS